MRLVWEGKRGKKWGFQQYFGFGNQQDSKFSRETVVNIIQGQDIYQKSSSNSNFSHEIVS